MEMKKNNILYCVTFCLLSAVSDNQGSELLDSLFCYTEFLPEIIHCTWSENLVSGQLLNMSLVIVNVSSKSVCPKTKLPSSSLTHQTWTCKTPMGGRAWTDSIKLGFLPERNLESWLNVPEDRDEAKPQKRHCNVTDGNRIKCSWQVRKEIAESIDFILFYSKNGRDEKCSPTCLEMNPPYLLCECAIDQVNTSAVLKTIHISPKKLEDSTEYFRLCLNIRLPPRNLTINEKKSGESFITSVKKEASEKEDFLYHYQLCYWRQEDLKSREQVSNDCPVEPMELEPHVESTVNLDLGHELQPSSNYSVKIRVRLKGSEPTKCYNGPWSEWSRVQTLQTKEVVAAPNATLLYVLIPTCVVVIVICALCGYRVIKRYTTQWNDRIPNPGKSSIINGFQKTKARLSLTVRHLVQSSRNRYGWENGATNFPYEEHVYVEPCNNVVMWTSSTSKDSAHRHLKQDKVCAITPSIEPALDDDDTQNIFVSDPSDNYPTASLTEGYTPFTEVMNDQENEQENSDTEDSQFAYSAFDGPYLFYKDSSS